MTQSIPVEQKPRGITQVEVLPRRLSEADEFLHATGTDSPDKWQENMMVVAWDIERAVGFWFHIQRSPARRFCELKYAVIGIGKGASGKAIIPMPADCMYEGLSIEKPFHKLRLNYQGMGTSTPKDADLPCLAENGSIPVGFDVALNGLAGPIDWHIPLSVTFPSVESDHYEMAGAWEGRLRLGDEHIDAAGLFYRDHTWGNRNYTTETDRKAKAGHGGFDLAWWSPVVLDEGRTFFNGMMLRTTAGQVAQFSTLTEGEMTTVMPRFNAVVTEGAPNEICRYRRVTVGGGTKDDPFDMQFKINRHLPMYLPDHGPDFVQSDGLGLVTWGKRTGWGSAQLSLTTPGWKSWPEFAEQITALDK